MTSRKPICWAIGVALSISAPFACATSVMDAYFAAQKNDPQFRSAVAENQAGQEYKNLGKSGLLPTVQYVYATSKNKAQQTLSATPYPEYTSITNNVSLRQVLFSLDATARFKQGKVQTKQSDAILLSKSADLIVRLFSAYADAKYAEDQLSLIQAQRDTLAEQLRLNETMLKKGEGTRTDVLETRAKLDVAEAQVIEAADNVNVTRNTLAAMTGDEIRQLDKFRDNFALMSLSTTKLSDWEQIARDNNPELLAARYSVEASELEIDKAKAGHTPRLDLNASYNRSISDTLQTLRSDNTVRSIGVQLVVPIYSGGSVSASSRQAVANKERATSDLDGANKRVLNELSKQFYAMQSGTAKMRALEKSVESANLLVDATSKSIKAGFRINVDLLNAHQQLTLAKRDLAMARYGYLLSFLRLRAAAGVLSQDDLQTVAAYFTK